jgi:hypothetical protein
MTESCVCSAERSTASKRRRFAQMGLGCAGERNEKTPSARSKCALDDQSARRLVYETENPETAAAVNVVQRRCRRCHGVDGAAKYRPASKTFGKGISSSPCRRLEPGRDAIMKTP